ncbi:MAG TPA: SpoIIE family protein phosphatase [Candidatus Acidoferrales bacterium]|nr:SpoIIE family protein phosphatase [Candidatus Acidoferrales bacterium]
MASPIESMILQQLQDRKEKLREAIAESPDARQLMHLLREVDLALEKIGAGTYGFCETCRDTIEIDRLIADPLVRNCLAHLTEMEQRTLERDLDLAHEIQAALLPKRDLALPGWDSAYNYEAAGPVSGDYCDIVIPENSRDSFFFMVGDVSGKGVAASMLMSQLHATFRTLTATRMPLAQILSRANRVFCEGSLITHFATLVCGLAESSGEIEICNAGHPSPIIVHKHKTERIPSSNLPLGIFCSGQYDSQKTRLESGESLVLFTDGLSETPNGSSEQYGEDRLIKLLAEKSSLPITEIISACLKDLATFRGQSHIHDDLTMMALRRK